jgi:hypothetical protein
MSSHGALVRFIGSPTFLELLSLFGLLGSVAVFVLAVVSR